MNVNTFYLGFFKNIFVGQKINFVEGRILPYTSSVNNIIGALLRVGRMDSGRNFTYDVIVIC